MTSLPVADDGVFAATSAFYDRLDGVREILTDPARTSVRLVVNPERMVIAEARRTYTYLSLFGYRVDAVVANRLLPDAIADPWFDRWKALHAEHLQHDRGRLRAAAGPQGRAGPRRARRRRRPCAASAPGSTASSTPPPSCTRASRSRSHDADGRTTLSLELPFADRDDLELGRRGDELLVKVGGHRRAIALPDSLRSRPDHRRQPSSQGRLTVTFDGSGDDG